MTNKPVANEKEFQDWKEEMRKASKEKGGTDAENLEEGRIHAEQLEQMNTDQDDIPRDNFNITGGSKAFDMGYDSVEGGNTSMNTTPL